MHLCKSEQFGCGSAQHVPLLDQQNVETQKGFDLPVAMCGLSVVHPFSTHAAVYMWSVIFLFLWSPDRNEGLLGSPGHMCLGRTK